MFVPFRTTRTVIQKLLAQNTAVTPIDVKGRTSDVYAKLDKIINGQDGVVDGTLLQNFWFPTQAAEYDVFISHSHNDLDDAVNLASWLEKRCGLRCFIDHFVWNSADDLLKRIDNAYTWEPERNVYDYNKRNFSTSHVHAMLSMAILDIIDRSECCFFIESDESISLEGIKTKTLSPWIYEELTYMKKGRITIPERYHHLRSQIRMYAEGARIEMINESRELEVSYDVNLKNFAGVDVNDLQSLQGQGLHGLDRLYQKKGALRFRELLR